MTAEEHTTLYNIGLKLSCSNNVGYHLCPKIRNYKYFSYWAEVSKESKKSENIKFGSTVNGKTIQLDRKTGEEQVSLTESISMCKDFPSKNQVKMVWTPPYSQKRCKNVIQGLIDDGQLAWYMEYVAIEKTHVLEENSKKPEKWDIPLIDFADVFDEAAMITHFRSLFYLLLQKVSRDEPANDVIDLMACLLHNWELIYKEREGIIKQIQSYILYMKLGIEEKCKVNGDTEYMSSRIEPELEARKAAPDLLSFLFLDESARRRFKNCATVLTEYLTNYLNSDAKELLDHLLRLNDKDLNINSIKGLKKVRWDLPNGKIDNAATIMKHLCIISMYPEGNILEFTA